MSGCTVFVFLSLMEYALVNIVMGDIADIEKKKSSGLTNLLLGVRAPGLGMAGGIKQQKSFQAMQELAASGQDGEHKADSEVGIIHTCQASSPIQELERKWLNMALYSNLRLRNFPFFG